MKKYTVFSMRVANYLVSNGFLLLGTGVNIKNPKYMCFFFNDSEEIRSAIKEANIKSK